MQAWQCFKEKSHGPVHLSGVLVKCVHKCNFAYQNEVMLRESRNCSGEFSLFVRLGEFIHTKLKPYFPAYNLIVCVVW